MMKYHGLAHCNKRWKTKSLKTCSLLTLWSEIIVKTIALPSLHTGNSFEHITNGDGNLSLWITHESGRCTRANLHVLEFTADKFIDIYFPSCREALGIWNCFPQVLVLQTYLLKTVSLSTIFLVLVYSELTKQNIQQILLYKSISNTGVILLGMSTILFLVISIPTSWLKGISRKYYSCLPKFSKTYKFEIKHFQTSKTGMSL